MVREGDGAGGARYYVAVYSSGDFWSQSRSKGGRSYFIQEMKSCLEFVLNNRYFQVGSMIFRQVTDIPNGSDPAPFFVKIFLFFCDSD